jgi:uncharacterized protein with FMN-binding domain
MDKKNIGMLAIALIVILGVGAFFFSFKGKQEMQQITTPSSSQNTVPSSIQVKYKDGLYKQEGDYTSPGGAEQIDVALTIKDGVISDVTVTPKAENPKSKYMQNVFVENYKPMVLGKNLKDLKLGKVAGSSLTPKGFNDAIEKIKTQAKT